MIVPIILDCLRDTEEEERRIVGITLVDELAEALGFKICSEMVLYDFLNLQEDPIFKVRRELVLRLFNISKLIGEKMFTGIIIPVFRKCSQD